MRVLVIGGTLFIGRLLVKQLLAASHDVAVLHRKPDHDLGCGVENLVADRNDPGAVRRALSGRRFDAVFDNVYDWERGTTAGHVLSTARACGSNLTRYVFMSSVGAYVEGLDRREDDPLWIDSPIAYARHKAASERALFGLHSETGFPAVTLRPPYIYGPGNPLYRERFFWDRMARGEPITIPGDGSRLMQFVHVHDLVRACMRVLDTPAAVGQAFNIANPEPITQLDLVHALAQAAGAAPELQFAPRDQLQGDRYFGEMFDFPPITTVTEKALRLLGFQTTGFAAGLKETFQTEYEPNAAAPPARD